MVLIWVVVWNVSTHELVDTFLIHSYTVGLYLCFVSLSCVSCPLCINLQATGNIIHWLMSSCDLWSLLHWCNNNSQNYAVNTQGTVGYAVCILITKQRSTAFSRWKSTQNKYMSNTNNLVKKVYCCWSNQMCFLCQIYRIKLLSSQFVHSPRYVPVAPCMLSWKKKIRLT